MIVAFTGERKSGKDYLTNVLVKTSGATRLSFSDEVRYLTTEIFPWMPFDFHPKVKDEPFIHINNPNNLTPRDVWLLLGQVRNVDGDYFVKRFAKRREWEMKHGMSSSELYIITDLRTPQEYEIIKKYNIPIVKIELANRDGIMPDPFEKWVRDFKDYDSLFINNMNGSSEFESYFYEEFGQS